MRDIFEQFNEAIGGPQDRLPGCIRNFIEGDEKPDLRLTLRWVPAALYKNLSYSECGPIQNQTIASPSRVPNAR